MSGQSFCRLSVSVELETIAMAGCKLGWTWTSRVRGSNNLVRRWVGGGMPSQSASSRESIQSASWPGNSSFSAQSRQSYLRSNIVLNSRFMKGRPHSDNFTTSYKFVLHAYTAFLPPTQVGCEAVIRYCHRSSLPSRSYEAEILNR